MPKLYVPDIGDRIRLSEDWTFQLHCESRNDSLLKKAGHPSTYHYSQPAPGPWPYTLPAGTLLDVDRIYIRKNMDDFSSISFSILDDPQQKKSFSGTTRAGRFWAKLEDVNTICYERLDADQDW